MARFGYLLPLLLCVGAFVGLVVYRTWQDRREDREKAVDLSRPASAGKAA